MVACDSVLQCLKDYAVGILCLVTTLVFCGALFRMRKSHVPPARWDVGILALSVVQCALGLIHYGIVQSTGIILALRTLKVLQCVAITWIFIVGFARPTTRRIVNIGCALITLYFVVLYFLTLMYSSTKEKRLCGDGIWPALSISWLVFSLVTSVVAIWFFRKAFSGPLANHNSSSRLGPEDDSGHHGMRDAPSTASSRPRHWKTPKGPTENISPRPDSSTGDAGRRSPGDDPFDLNHVIIERDSPKSGKDVRSSSSEAVEDASRVGGVDDNVDGGREPRQFLLDDSSMLPAPDSSWQDGEQTAAEAQSVSSGGSGVNGETNAYDYSRTTSFRLQTTRKRQARRRDAWRSSHGQQMEPQFNAVASLASGDRFAADAIHSGRQQPWRKRSLTDSRPASCAIDLSEAHEAARFVQVATHCADPPTHHHGVRHQSIEYDDDDAAEPSLVIEASGRSRQPGLTTVVPLATSSGRRRSSEVSSVDDLLPATSPVEVGGRFPRPLGGDSNQREESDGLSASAAIEFPSAAADLRSGSGGAQSPTDISARPSEVYVEVDDSGSRSPMWGVSLDTEPSRESSSVAGIDPRFGSGGLSGAAVAVGLRGGAESNFSDLEGGMSSIIELRSVVSPSDAALGDNFTPHAHGDDDDDDDEMDDDATPQAAASGSAQFKTRTSEADSALGLLSDFIRIEAYEPDQSIMVPSVVRKRKRLLILIVLETLSALVTVIWDIVLLAFVRRHEGASCDQFFGQVPSLEVAAYVVSQTISSLVPHWVVLWAFYWVDRRLYMPLRSNWDVNLQGVEMVDARTIGEATTWTPPGGSSGGNSPVVIEDDESPPAVTGAALNRIGGENPQLILTTGVRDSTR